MLTSGVSDLKVTLEDMVAEGDKVAVRWNGSSKHAGDFMGIPPTNKQLSMTGISIIRIDGGKIVEEWGEMDMMGLILQTGAFPPPG
jgi:predicted ester cyclase